MIKFDNKLELRYYFNDKSNYMDAMIKHRSEKEVLSLVRTLADMLDIKMTIYCESLAQQEGFREIWSVAGENSRLISIVAHESQEEISRRDSHARIGGTAKRIASRLQVQIEFLRSCARLSESDEVHPARTERKQPQPLGVVGG